MVVKYIYPKTSNASNTYIVVNAAFLSFETSKLWALICIFL